MNVYLVLLLSGNLTVEQRINDAYPDALQYNDTVFLVMDPSPVTEDVAIRAGIKGDGRVEDSSGFVVKFGSPLSYSGFTTRSLWDWLRAADEKVQ